MQLVTVTVPPEPFVEPSEIPGGNAGAELAIKAVTEELAAPNGWLGRSLGKQTLELVDTCWPYQLPYGPIIGVKSISYTDDNGVVQTLDEAEYALLGNMLVPLNGWPSAQAVRITYEAGYEEVPANAKYAVMLAAQSLLTAVSEDMFVTSETVEGVGSIRREIGEAAHVAVNDSIKRLLAPLRVFL